MAPPPSRRNDTTPSSHAGSSGTSHSHRGSSSSSSSVPPQQAPAGERLYAVRDDGMLIPVEFRGSGKRPRFIACRNTGKKLRLIDEAEKDRILAERMDEQILNSLKLVGDLTVKDVTKTTATLCWDHIEKADDHTQIAVELKGPSQKKFAEVGRPTSNSFGFEGLKAGRTYEARLVPHRKGKQAKPTPSTTFTMATSAPSDLGPVLLTNKQPRALTLKWHKPKDTGGLPIKEYTLLWDGGDSALPEDDLIVLHRSQALTHKVRDLEVAHTYRFALECRNEKGASPRSQTSTFATAVDKPGMPGALRLVRAGVDSLTLKWDPAEGGGCDISEYILEMQDHAKGYGFMPKFRGPERQHTVTGLEKDTEYSFRLCAKNEGGKTGPFTETETFKTKPRAPPPPTDPTLVGKPTTTGFTVRWEPPKKPEDPIVCYMLEMDAGQRPPPAPKSGQVRITPKAFKAVYTGQEKVYEAKNLVPGRVYCLRCCCIGQGGQGRFSDVVRIKTLPNTPAPPSLYQPVASTATCLHVGWRPPTHEKDGGEQPTEYEVAVMGPFPTKGAGAAAAKAQGDPPSDLFPVLAGGSKTKKKAAKQKTTQKANAAGDNTQHSSGGEETRANISANAGTADSKASSASAAASASVGDSPVWRPFARETTRRSSFEVVKPGEVHVFRARCRNRRGWSAWSTKLMLESKATAPEPPTNVTVASVRADEMTVSFSPGFSNGSDTTQYRVQYAPAAKAKEESTDTQRSAWKSVTSTSPNAELKDLKPNTAYIIFAEAKNALGWSRPSVETNVQTQATAPNTPPPPHVEAVTRNSVTLRVIPVENGEMPSEYTIAYDDDNTVVVSPPHMEVMLSDLKPDTRYRVRVRARNHVGHSPPSQVEVRTRALPPDPPTLNVVEVTGTSIKLAWAPTASNVTRTRLFMQAANDTKFKEVSLTGSKRSHKLNKLRAGVEYAFKAQCLNEEGWGECGEPVHVRTDANAGRPEPLRVTRLGDNTVAVRVEEKRGQETELLVRASTTGNDEAVRTALTAGDVQLRCLFRGADEGQAEDEEDVLDNTIQGLQRVTLGSKPTIVCRSDEAGRAILHVEPATVVEGRAVWVDVLARFANTKAAALVQTARVLFGPQDAVNTGGSADEAAAAAARKAKEEERRQERERRQQEKRAREKRRREATAPTYNPGLKNVLKDKTKRKKKGLDQHTVMILSAATALLAVLLIVFLK